MRTFVAHVTTYETGMIRSITITDSSEYHTVTYDESDLANITAPVMGILTRSSRVPHLADYNTTAEWREALLDYVTRLARYRASRARHEMPYALGNRLVHVDDKCSTYTYEVDLDMSEVPLT